MFLLYYNAARVLSIKTDECEVNFRIMIFDYRLRSL